MPTIVNKGWFKPGHPAMGAAVAGYPRKGPRQPSIRQQRKLQYAAVSKMIAEMAAAQDRHEPVDPVDLTRLIHLHMRLTAEL